MRDKTKITVLHTAPGGGEKNSGRLTVSLPAPPWELEMDDRSATAPRNPPIRREVRKPCTHVQTAYAAIVEAWKEAIRK